MTPILYSFRRCPYAMRARLALASSGQRVRLREVVLRDKPPHMLAISPKGTVPVLLLPDGQVIDESLDVMRWALHQDDPEGWLLPATGSVEDMLALISQNDGDFKHNLDRYKYAARFEGADPVAHREAAEPFLGMLEARLSGQAYLFGDKPSLADFATLPFIRQFAHVDMAWFESSPYAKVCVWLATFKAGTRFKGIMKKYPQWREGDAEVLFPEEG